ncbi:hypothetical protein OPT61_g9654 [Boeremia exigua]|uniref:Uncharacterized protein n=1 Tax=Boeremia exigua TaxID=749465 RepID=A0ACC2HTG1_9PLEO|nr:hypothetical protein OPT61_g9654 [Boeremia exigua]
MLFKCSKRGQLQASTLLESVASRGDRLVRADNIQKKVLERDEDVEDLVADERKQNKRRRNHGVHEIVVGRRNNGDQDKGRVSNSKKEIKQLPERVLAHLAALERPAEKPGVIDQRHSNAERVAKVHRRHRGELVDVFAAHPHALRIVVAHRVEEPVLRGQQTRRHAGIDDKGDERAEIGQCQGSAGDSECVERRRGVVVPRDKPTHD